MTPPPPPGHRPVETRPGEHVGDLEAEVMELRRKLTASERALAHSERLQALGQLISGVAHELANPLTAMIARATLIGGAKTLDAARAHAEIIEAQGKRATQIVRNLSSFARRRAAAPAVVSLNTVVRSVIELHGYQLEANQIELVVELEPDLSPVQADPHEMEQVVLNLVMNAQYAMVQAHGRGRLEITTRSDGELVHLTVEDDGPGIPDDVASQIFKPFFSTKGEAGTGLGLAITQDLVKRSGGRIRLRTQPGAGTAMTIELPCTRAEAPAIDTTEPTTVAPRLRGRFLVVDDERDIGELIAELLRRQGYEVEYVESAMRALERLRGGTFQGIISDLRMPDMNGTAFWEAVCREQPALARRMIFVTGDHAAPESAKLLEVTGCPCLTKPFRSEELYEAVAGVLA
jgi:nitrogen-specific signal transduction histidine kinase/CheY-like chemotaxis protein